MLTNYIIGWIRKHPYLIRFGLISLLGAVIIIFVDYHEYKINGDNALGGIIGVEKAVVNETVKATVKATPAVTPAPKYDYYDPEFKIGVIIEGNDQVKNNITNLIKTWKEITPDDYKDKFPYAPKKIFVSTDGFNGYGSGNDDYIRLDKSTEMRGKYGNLNNTLIGVAGLRAEWNNAKKSKTGIRFATGYDAEVDSNKGFTDYLAMTGLMTQKQADAYLENISKRINPNGTYKN